VDSVVFFAVAKKKQKPQRQRASRPIACQESASSKNNSARLDGVCLFSSSSIFAVDGAALAQALCNILKGK
jgi:hypothetical protein